MDVKRVIVYNRVDCCTDRLSYSVASLLDQEGSPVKTYTTGDATGVHVFDIDFITNSVGYYLARKVRVQLQGTNWLRLREVEVFDDKGVNLAFNKTATQSSTHSADHASVAVDGEQE